MAFFKPIYKKMSKKWHPQAVSVGKPIEMDELCKQIALISTVSSADSKATLEALGLVVPLRRLAARLGVEKVFLKGGRMSLFFVSNPDSPYYQSQAFGKVIAYMMKYTRRCDLREQNNKRSMLVKDVKTVEEAVCVLQEVVAMQVEE